MTVYYLAGRMTGIPQFNIPAFEAAALHLRAAGHNVVSPTEQDSPAVRALALASAHGDLVDLAPADETWGYMLARCVKTIADEVDGIVFLPTWERSRGARLEALTGLLCGKSFAYYDSSSADGLYHIPPGQVHDVLKRNIPR